MPLKPMNSGRGQVSCLILKLPIVWVWGASVLCVRCVKGRNINTSPPEINRPLLHWRTYGELFSITRQAIINDDLNMLTDVPMKLGRAAKSTIADLVYAILTSNPKISTDNVSLFDKAETCKRTGERCNGRGIAG